MRMIILSALFAVGVGLTGMGAASASDRIGHRHGGRIGLAVAGYPILPPRPPLPLGHRLPSRSLRPALPCRTGLPPLVGKRHNPSTGPAESRAGFFIAAAFGPASRSGHPPGPAARPLVKACGKNMLALQLSGFRRRPAVDFDHGDNKSLQDAGFRPRAMQDIPGKCLCECYCYRPSLHSASSWRQRAAHRRDEMRALVGERQPARLQHVARQEKAGERKAVGQIAAGRQRIAVAQEGRQPQHLVGPRLAGGARDRPPRFRRDIDEIGRSRRSRRIARDRARSRAPPAAAIRNAPPAAPPAPDRRAGRGCRRTRA